MNLAMDANISFFSLNFRDEVIMRALLYLIVDFYVAVTKKMKDFHEYERKQKMKVIKMFQSRKENACRWRCSPFL